MVTVRTMSLDQYHLVMPLLKLSEYTTVGVSAFITAPHFGMGKFDGKDQPAGTYLYYIEAEHFDKYDYNKVITEKVEGTVTLLR